MALWTFSVVTCPPECFEIWLTSHMLYSLSIAEPLLCKDSSFRKVHVELYQILAMVSHCQLAMEYVHVWMLDNVPVYECCLLQLQMVSELVHVEYHIFITKHFEWSTFNFMSICSSWKGISFNLSVCESMPTWTIMNARNRWHGIQKFQMHLSPKYIANNLYTVGYCSVLPIIPCNRKSTFFSEISGFVDYFVMVIKLMTLFGMDAWKGTWDYVFKC